MVMSLATFRTTYREFNEQPDPYVQAKLDEALRNTAVTAWGTFADDAQGLKAAHLLWSSPFGSTMRDDEGHELTDSRYSKLLDDLAFDVIDTSCVVTGCPRVR